MKNKLVDLNNLLFAQLEALGDDTIAGEKLDELVRRANVAVGISTNILKGATLQIEAARIVADYGQGDPTRYLPLVEDRDRLNGHALPQ